MTPSKEKKPLPRRRRRRSSIILQPASFKHWHHSISCLRLLLLKGLFAEVVVRCNTLLFEPAIANIHPLHLSSLHFLRALAEESAGRLQPLLSAQRLSRLQRAKADYEDAISVLDQDVLLSLFPSTPRPQLSNIQRPKPLLSRICAPTLSDLSDVDEEEDPFVDGGLPLEELKAEIRLREKLREFQERLTWHRERVWACTDETVVAQAARQRRLSSNSGIEEKRDDAQARIARGKREGWKRVRFDPERVQDLCHLALAEL